MDFEKIKIAIAHLFPFEIIGETDEFIQYKVYQDKTSILNKKKVESIIEELATVNSEEGIELFNNNSYEVLVRYENRIVMSMDRDIHQSDSVNKLEYKISKPTDKYLIFFLYNLSLQNTPRILRSGFMMSRIRRSFEMNDSLNHDIIQLVKDTIPRLETLQITSQNSKAKTKEDFEQLVYAFLFNLGYNTEYIVQPLRFIDEFIQSYRSNRIKRGGLSDIEAPRRSYINELVLHYQKGMSSDSIDHQYLSFYHVLEFFYEKVYNDDILSSVKLELTKPNFSYKRNKDISNLIGIIQKKLKYRNDEFIINEPEALELTLRKFVKNLGFLASELKGISSDLINYYKTKEVSFSKGNKVDFDNTDFDNIYINLTKRIYLTRNAIVHSKETDKSKYTPFRDDKELLMEIYLIRLIAEIIIIETSKEL